jgi:hypothetical protein
LFLLEKVDTLSCRQCQIGRQRRFAFVGSGCVAQVRLRPISERRSLHWRAILKSANRYSKKIMRKQNGADVPIPFSDSPEPLLEQAITPTADKTCDAVRRTRARS